MSNTTLNALLVNATAQSSNDKPQIVNFALNGKMLVNGSDGNGRIMIGNDQSNAVVSSAGLSMPVMLVLIFVIASIVGVIVTALFVMRRRFSTWRLDLNNSKTSKTGGTPDPEAGDVKTDIKSEEKVSDEAETKKESTEETKEVPTTIDTNTQGSETTKDGQSSPSSNSPLINNTEVTKTEAAPVTEETTLKVDQITSSSSLIVNVLNELSESVACKLAGEANADPEKEPLNEQKNE